MEEEIEQAVSRRNDVIERFLQKYSEELKVLPVTTDFGRKCSFLRGHIVRIHKKNYQLDNPVITEKLWIAISDLAEGY